VERGDPRSTTPIPAPGFWRWPCRPAAGTYRGGVQSFIIKH